MEISDKESNLKICKIENKTVVKKGKVQLNLHDGRNLLVEKDSYKTNDSLLIEFPNKVVKHVKFEPNNLVVVTGGKNSGKTGKIKKIEPKKVICKIDNSTAELRKDHLVVVGEDKPLIDVVQ
jgi:small subunit ribosomal protein S4e